MGFQEEPQYHNSPSSHDGNVEKLVDKKMFVAVFFLDFRKAFDSFDHNVILKKLSASGISGNIYEWINNYLSVRQQVTLVNGKVSKVMEVNCGAPQRSLLVYFN